MKPIVFFVTAAFILFIGGCVEDYESGVQFSNPDPALVVEGQVTNEEGPYKVKLSRTFGLSGEFSGDSVTGADVEILDDSGHAYVLSHTGNGWYETSDKHLRGIPGHSYMLHITTDDGKQYESTPVTMKEVPGIDSVYFLEEAMTTVENEKTTTERKLNIYVDSEASEGSTEFLRWSFTETWEIRLRKNDIRIKKGQTANSIVRDDVTLADGIREICWITKPSASILVGSAKNHAMNKIDGMLVNSIGEGDTRLNIEYSILVRQYALSEEMYKFWKTLRDVNEKNGGMYDRIPGQIFGNITCCTGGGKALGYFTASAVSEKRIFITRGDHNMKTSGAYDGCIYTTQPNPRVAVFVYGTETTTGETVYTQDVYCSDCRANGSGEKPDFWK